MKIKFLMMALLAVAALCVTSCEKESTPQTRKGELSLYPNGLSTNDEYAKKVVAFYQSAVGSDATVTYTKTAKADDGYDFYTIQFDYTAATTTSLLSKLDKIDYTSLESQLPADNYRADYSHGAYTTLYSRNLLAGTWKGKVGDKDLTVTIKDDRTNESASASAWNNSYTVKYGDKTYNSDKMDYKAKYSNGAVHAQGDFLEKDGATPTLDLRIELTKGINQEESCKVTILSIDEKTQIDGDVTMTK